MKKIAVVGLSKDPAKPSHYVPKYMQEQGYKIMPANPTAGENINIVNIFRPSNEVLQIVKEAIPIGSWHVC